jgi:hypothetical protein
MGNERTPDHGDPRRQQTNVTALVPAEKLQGIDLDAIDHQILNLDDYDLQPGAGNWIISLYKRLGLEPTEHPVTLKLTYDTADLAEFKNPSFPCSVDKVVVFGWAV